MGNAQLVIEFWYDDLVDFTSILQKKKRTQTQRAVLLHCTTGEFFYYYYSCACSGEILTRACIRALFND